MFYIVLGVSGVLLGIRNHCVGLEELRVPEGTRQSLPCPSSKGTLVLSSAIRPCPELFIFKAWVPQELRGKKRLLYGASDHTCSVVVVPAAVAQLGQPQMLKEDAVVENEHDFNGRRC